MAMVLANERAMGAGTQYGSILPYYTPAPVCGFIALLVHTYTRMVAYFHVVSASFCGLIASVYARCLEHCCYQDKAQRAWSP